jgi:hypothetical protein
VFDYAITAEGIPRQFIHQKNVMAIIVKTNNPGALLKTIISAIDNNDIETWEYDGDGDFIHTPDQWKGLAWLRPKTYLGELRFGNFRAENVEMSNVVYGVYHGRFIEMQAFAKKPSQIISKILQ